MKDKKRVQSIDRAVAILECFSEENKEYRLSEISEKLDLNKSTVHGIITTLKYHGFVSQDEETQKYKLGIRFIEFGQLVVNSINIRDAASPVIDELCGRIDETVHIGMLDGLDIVWIEKKECTKSVKISTKIGGRLPAYTTADGKVLLSYLEEGKLKKYLPKKIPQFTKNTITRKADFVKRLIEIKKNGYAIDNEEFVEGIKCVAAPIFDHNGNAKFCLSTTAPAFRMNDEKILDLVAVIKEAADEISRNIGYKG